APPPPVDACWPAGARRWRGPPRRPAGPAYRALLAHDWPGNVRELEHALEQAVALASGDEIELDDLPGAVRGGPEPDAGRDPGPPGTFKDAKQRVIERFERQFIMDAL